MVLVRGRGMGPLPGATARRSSGPGRGGCGCPGRCLGLAGRRCPGLVLPVRQPVLVPFVHRPVRQPVHRARAPCPGLCPGPEGLFRPCSAWSLPPLPPVRLCPGKSILRAAGKCPAYPRWL